LNHNDAIYFNPLLLNRFSLQPMEIWISLHKVSHFINCWYPLKFKIDFAENNLNLKHPINISDNQRQKFLAKLQRYKWTIKARFS